MLSELPCDLSNPVICAPVRAALETDYLGSLKTERREAILSRCYGMSLLSLNQER